MPRIPAAPLAPHVVIDGAISQFQVPGDGHTQFSFAQGINNAGTFVGYYDDDKGNHGYIDQNGTITTLDEPDGDAGETFAYGINNNGQVSGSFELPGGEWEPFVYDQGTYTEYQVSAADFSHVGINDAGPVGRAFRRLGRRGADHADGRRLLLCRHPHPDGAGRGRVGGDLADRGTGGDAVGRIAAR